MLTQESYQIAWLVYGLAAGGILLCLHLWWLGSLGGPARLSILLLLAVFMLMPVGAGDDVDTLAPAIVVAGFDFLTHGPETAASTANLLGLMCALALVPGIAWGLLRWRKRRAPDTAEGT